MARFLMIVAGGVALAALIGTVNFGGAVAQAPALGRFTIAGTEATAWVVNTETGAVSFCSHIPPTSFGCEWVGQATAQ